MLAKLRSRLTFANVVSVIALFIALGGSGYAATKINGKNIKNKSISGKKLKNRTITKSKVKRHTLTATEIRNGSLLAESFKAGELPAGPRGPQGLTGPAGTNGANGTARAYARVRPGGVGGCPPQPCLIFEAKGISSVTHTATGEYCVVAPSIDSADVTPAVSVDSGESTDPEGNASAMTNGGESCGGGGFVVRTERQPSTAVRNAADTGTTSVAGNAVPADDVGFAIVIP